MAFPTFAGSTLYPFLSLAETQRIAPVSRSVRQLSKDYGASCKNVTGDGALCFPYRVRGPLAKGCRPYCEGRCASLVAALVAHVEAVSQQPADYALAVADGGPGAARQALVVLKRESVENLYKVHTVLVYRMIQTSLHPVQVQMYEVGSSAPRLCMA